MTDTTPGSPEGLHAFARFSPGGGGRSRQPRRPRNASGVAQPRRGSQGECLEVARGHATVPVRDSKAVTGPALLFAADGRQLFVSGVRDGRIGKDTKPCEYKLRHGEARPARCVGSKLGSRD
ncbi:DUF397 domain-containing protein [Streptomyces incarnatus]|uniref:DUF397 domain-containing protein n=1 Tax=Streptomyces incarnatus TaxID=665007 RepID=UPI001AD7F45C